jgi:hypothetical protein
MLVMDDDFVPLFLLLSCQHPSILALLLEAKLKHFLSLEELRKRDRRIPHCALVDARQSSFLRLYHSRNDQSFITFTGRNCLTFEYLLDKFRPLYHRYSPYSVIGKIVRLRNPNALKGRPRVLGPAACFGLVLGYTWTRGSLFAMQMIFGASHSVLCLFLRFSMRLLFKVLKEEPLARLLSLLWRRIGNIRLL